MLRILHNFIHKYNLTTTLFLSGIFFSLHMAPLGAESSSSSIASENSSSSHNATLLNDDFTSQTEIPHVSYSEEEAALLNQYFARFKKQLDVFLSTAQHLAQLVSQNKIAPNDPYEAHVWLQQLSGLIIKTMQLPYAPLTPHKLIRFFTFNKTLIRAFTVAFENNLNSRPTLAHLENALEELKSALQNHTRTGISVHAVQGYASETESSINALSQRVSTCGLTWYNTFYRKLASLNKNLHLSTLFTTGALTALGTGALLYFLPPMYELKTDNGKTKAFSHSFFGDIQAKLHQSALGEHLKQYGNPHSDMSQRFIAIQTTINAVGVLHTMGVFSKISQLWSDTDAFLKGTTNDSFKSLVQYIDDFTLDDPMFDCVRHKFEPFNSILKFLEDPDLYIRSGMNIPKCLLLTGTPGSGKTHSARALAGSINKKFAELGRFDKAGFIEVEPWDLGQIEELIIQAKANAPCVIFIDEFHLFGGGAQINSNALWLSKLLTEIDKVDKTSDPSQQIFIVAATNRPDLLAQALLRHGRFGTRIEFPIPDFNQRKSVFVALCAKSAVDTTHIDLDHLSHITQGCSFSTISKIFEKAGFIAKQRAEGITYDHLYQAINQVLRGLDPHSTLSEKEKEIISTHMAGIACAYNLIETSHVLDAVTIQMPQRKVTEQLDFIAKMDNHDENKQHKAQYGAFYTYNAYEHIMPSTKDKFSSTKLLLAGVVAQEVLLASESSYGSDDRQLAYENTEAILLRGLKPERLSKTALTRIKDQALKVVEQCETELRELFKKHETSLRKIAEELKTKTFLTATEIKALMSSQQKMTK